MNLWISTGRPARSIGNRIIRELGPLRDDIPEFPGPAAGIAPLRAASEKSGSGDFSPLWAGQAAALARELGAGAVTRQLAGDAQRLLAQLGAVR